MKQVNKNAYNNLPSKPWEEVVILSEIINNRWKLTVDKGNRITLHDITKKVSHKEYTGSGEVFKYYNVHIRNKNEIVVSGTIRSSFPNLPNYLKKEIIKFVKDYHGDADYKVLNGK